MSVACLYVPLCLYLGSFVQCGDMQFGWAGLQLPLRELRLSVQLLSCDMEATALTKLPKGGYLLIPHSPQPLRMGLQELLVALLAHSTDTVIDIVLPYPLSRSDTSSKTARYILYGGKLQGIWMEEGSVTSVSVPAGLQQHYLASHIPFKHNEVPLGNFYLQLFCCRVGLLTTQRLDNMTVLVEQYGCDVLAVVADNYDPEQELTARLNESKLRVCAREKGVAVMVGGIRTVARLTKPYNNLSWIAQGTHSLKQPDGLGERGCLQYMADTALPLSFRSTSKPNSEQQTEPEQPQIDKLQLQTGGMGRGREVSEVYSTCSGVGRSQWPLLLHIYYLFRSFNGSSPFLLPYPFSNYRQELYHTLAALAVVAQLDLPQLVRVYQRTHLQQPLLPEDMQIYPSFQALSRDLPAESLLYVYSEEKQEVAALQLLYPALAHRVCNCLSLLPPLPLASPTLPQGKVQAACHQVIKSGLAGIDHILSYFWSLNLTSSEIELGFVDILPGLVRRTAKNSRWHWLLLQGTRHQIMEQLGLAQIRLKTATALEALAAADSHNRGLQVKEKVGKARNIKMRAVNMSKCHHCRQSFRPELTILCKQCSSRVCYHCADQLTQGGLTDVQQFSCLVCAGKCLCSACSHPSTSGLPTTNRAASVQWSCSRCLIVDEDYPRISLECVQCKDLKCYNCARLAQQIQTTRLNKWVCSDCRQFNLANSPPSPLRKQLSSQSESVLSDSSSSSRPARKRVVHFKRGRRGHMRPVKQASPKKTKKNKKIHRLHRHRQQNRKAPQQAVQVVAEPKEPSPERSYWGGGLKASVPAAQPQRPMEEGQKEGDAKGGLIFGQKRVCPEEDSFSY